jgi:hypothetical protein
MRSAQADQWITACQLHASKQHQGRDGKGRPSEVNQIFVGEVHICRRFSATSALATSSGGLLLQKIVGRTRADSRTDDVRLGMHAKYKNAPA